MTEGYDIWNPEDRQTYFFSDTLKSLEGNYYNSFTKKIYKRIRNYK